MKSQKLSGIIIFRVLIAEVIILKNIKYTIYKEGDYYVSECLNVEVSSFGTTIDEAIANLTEALELYFEDNDNVVYFPIEIAMLGEKTINA
jgi:predicted RNase H-like HicB family nuclease